MKKVITKKTLTILYVLIYIIYLLVYCIIIVPYILNDTNKYAESTDKIYSIKRVINENVHYLEIYHRKKGKLRRSRYYLSTTEGGMIDSIKYITLKGKVTSPGLRNLKTGDSIYFFHGLFLTKEQIDSIKIIEKNKKIE